MDYYQEENPIDLIESPYSIELVNRAPDDLFVVIDAV